MGCSQIDITPDFPSVLHGFSRNNYYENVEDPIFAGVIFLQNEEKRVLLITADLLGINIQDCQRLYAIIEESTGIGYPDIFIFGAHNHFAPNFCPYHVVEPGGELPVGVINGDEHYFEFFADRLRSALDKAIHSREAVTVDQADIPLPALHFNRRTIEINSGKCITSYVYPQNPENFIFASVDSDMSVWRFRKTDGTLKAILTRFSCHPVTGGNNPNAISADFPGAFRNAVMEHFGCPGFFMQGCAGDVVPMRRNGKSREDIGGIMAKSIRLSERLFHKVDSEVLRTRTAEITANLTRFPAGYSRAQAEADWQKKLDRCRALGRYDNELFFETFRHHAAMLYSEDTVRLPLQGLLLGNRVLIGLPLEVVSSIGLQFRKKCPHALMTTLTGGSELYLPSAEDFDKGGFEVELGANFAPDTADKLTAAATGLVKSLCPPGT